VERYAAVKERLVQQAQIAIVGVDDRMTWEIGECRLEENRDLNDRPTIAISGIRELKRGVFARNGQIVSTLLDGGERVLCDLAGVNSLRGAHNAQNAAAAAACVDLWTFEDGVINKGVLTFSGLPHRLEEVGRAGQVLFINDSKATNADAAARALSSFSAIYWIAGGRAKEGGAESLVPLMDNVRKAYLIGEAADDFTATLEGATETQICGTLERAVEEAFRAAREDDAAEVAVLLSPACASYDQFTNYESRGDKFRSLARSLPGVDSVGPAGQA